MKHLPIILKAYKNTRIFFIAIIFTIPHTTYANFPVIDVSSIAQSVLQFNQMVQEAVKYEKELKKLGVDTGRVGGILGQLDGITNGILTSMDAIKNLPDGLKNMFQELNEQCEFLKGSPEFKEQIDLEKKGLEGMTEALKEQTACLKAANNVKFMSEEMGRNLEKAQRALQKGDFDQYNSSMNAIKNMNKTRTYLRKSAAIEKKENYESVYGRYIDKSGKAGLSRTEISARHEQLIQQATKSTTQTDAQNFGNQLLVEIVRMLAMQYDTMMEYNSAMLALQSQDLDTMDKNQLKQRSYQEIKEEKAKFGVFAPDSAFEKYKGEYKKDALGLPIIGVSSK